MGHAYDTGLAVPQRTAIRDAVIARLTPLLKTATPALYLRAIKTIARPLADGREDPDFVQAILPGALLGQAPAIAVALGDETFDPVGTLPTELHGELVLALYVVSEHSRSIDEGRLYGDPISAADNTADPGLWTMLEHARELVAGQDLGITGVAEPRLRKVAEVVTAANVTIWEQRYSVGVSVDLNPARGITQLLLEIEGRHAFEGSAGGPAPLDPLVTLTPLDPEVP